MRLNVQNEVGVMTLRCFSEVTHWIISLDENKIWAKNPML